MLQALKKLVKNRFLARKDMPAIAAYNLWADDYDNQPDNLMFYLDEAVFTKLIEPLNLTGKIIADIGCGTGRHWPLVYKKQPEAITGFDVSAGMLQKLKLKFPNANTIKITDGYEETIPSETYDLVFSTLTIAHIENINRALTEWCRVLKMGGDLIITDFHPDALAAGGKRTFTYRDKNIAIVNYIHTIITIRGIIENQGLVLVNHQERLIDKSVMDYYIKQNALHVYWKFENMPMLYGLHFKKI